MSIGASKSSSRSEQGSESQATSNSVGGSTSRQSIAFSDAFGRLFGNASNAAGSAVNSDVLGTAATQLFSGGMSFFENLGGNEGTNYLADRVTGSNEILPDQIAALREDTGRFFSEELLPNIRSQAVAGGNLGGGRQGVAEGMAVEAAQRQFTRGVTDLRVADRQSRDSAALSVAQNAIGAASTGLGALPMLIDSAQNAASPELGIYQNLASILGGPTVLTESDSFSRSISDAFSKSFGNSKSSSAGFSFGF